MPVETFEPFDLGDLVSPDDAASQDYARWAGWKVTYRRDVMTSALLEMRSGDQKCMIAALAWVVVGWNFVDAQGEELPKPTRSNFLTIGLPDSLLLALMHGFLGCLTRQTAT